MPTNLQMAANRDNARKSTGPRTEAGRAAVRYNALTHGLTAATLVLEGESHEAFEDLAAAVSAEHAPATPTEEALVTQIVMAIWRLRRLYHIEAGFLTVSSVDAKSRLSNYSGLTPAHHFGFAAGRNPAALEYFSRFEARTQSCLVKALRELRQLQARRGDKVENQTQIHLVEPVLPEPQPQSPQDDNPSTGPAPAPEDGAFR